MTTTQGLTDAVSSSCKYNNNSEIDNSDCNTCFESDNCSINECKGVCDFKDGYQSEIVELYRSLFFKMKDFINKNDSLPKLEVNFNSFKTFGANGTQYEIKRLLESMYKNGTLNSKSNYVDKHRLDNILKSQEIMITDDGILLNNLKNTDNTSKRQMEININEFRKIEYNLVVIKQVVIFVAVMLLIPALVKFNILDKKSGMVIWMVLLVVISIYALFMIFVKNNNRDDIDFKQYNFVKPTDDEIARSRIAASMSSRDKERCKALSQMDDDFEPESINIDITPYRTKDLPSQGKCFSNQ